MRAAAACTAWQQGVILWPLHVTNGPSCSSINYQPIADCAPAAHNHLHLMLPVKPQVAIGCSLTRQAGCTARSAACGTKCACHRLLLTTSLQLYCTHSSVNSVCSLLAQHPEGVRQSTYWSIFSCPAIQRHVTTTTASAPTFSHMPDSLAPPGSDLANTLHIMHILHTIIYTHHHAQISPAFSDIHTGKHTQGSKKPCATPQMVCGVQLKIYMHPKHTCLLLCASGCSKGTKELLLLKEPKQWAMMTQG